jgi:hypothetical protein
MRESMNTQTDLNQINDKIQLMKKTAEELKTMGDNFPALNRNTVRILASLKMLEINISDILDADAGENDKKPSNGVEN